MPNFALVKKQAPQTVIVGESVEFEPVNGGWIVVRQKGGSSVSVPLCNVESVFPVDARVR